MEDISRTVVPKKPSSVRCKVVLKTIILCYIPTPMSKWKEQVPQTLAPMVPLATQEMVISRIVLLQVNHVEPKE